MDPMRRVFRVGAGGFILLGMATTVFGVAWPSAAGDLDRSLGDLGYVLFAYGMGYTLSSLVSGRLEEVAGISLRLILAASTASGSLVVLAISGGWVAFLAGTAVLGTAGGQIDAATNTYFAIRHGQRAMGLLHGAYGIGAIAGPLMITALLFFELSWRLSFAVLAVLELLYLAGLWWFARSLSIPGESGPGRVVRLRRSRALFWSIAVFLLYAGLATGLGSWTFTYLTEESGIGETAGGLIVTAYWAGFTLARLVMGAAGDRVEPRALLRWSGVVTVVAVAGFWLAPSVPLAGTALILAGFAHGPIFPLEMLLTPGRFGPGAAAAIVGYQVAAANVGGASISWLIGVAVARFGLGVIPPALTGLAAVVWLAIVALDTTGRPARSAQGAGGRPAP